jgi:hypothetical protein
MARKTIKRGARNRGPLDQMRQIGARDALAAGTKSKRCP